MKRPRQPCAILLGLLLAAAARGQSGWTPPPDVQSVSGQFQASVIGGFSPLLHHPSIVTNPEIVRLDPTLAAVSAERLKNSLARELGLNPGTAWRGKIFLTLHPAGRADDLPVIAAQPFLRSRNYRLEMPDVLPRQSYARSLTAVLLIEMADRETAGAGHPAEIPAWLADGLARKILTTDREQIIVSLPAKTVDGLSLTRTDETRRGLDPLAEARQTLRGVPALTFQQLSWPAPAQLAGADNGTYLASAHLFVNELLGLKNGPAKLRALLARLPACENWQTAFFAAFHDDFRRPLDVEKWWALRVVAFAKRDPGPHWTPEASRVRLAGLLSVPVEFRHDSNSLPEHAEISLQAAIRSLDPAQHEPVLRNRLRDLELAQLRLSLEFAAVADGYRQALADYLGDQKKSHLSTVANKHAAAPRRQAAVADTLKKLDALDARRREVEERLRIRTTPVSLPSALR